jgi:hypothetical protein
MIIHEVEQGSPEWLAVRMGIPTASEFSTLLASGKGGGESITRKKYLRRLAGERITGVPAETFSSADTLRGNAMEAQARAMYSLQTGNDVELVGFVTNDEKTIGASPDGFICGRRGAVEFKTALPHVLIEHIERSIREPLYFPSEHVAQTQGNLGVCELEFIDLAIFWPGMPLFVQRSFRDEGYLAKLRSACDQANAEIAEIVDRVSGYNGVWPVRAYTQEAAQL